MDDKRPVREDLFGQRYLKSDDDIWKHNAWDEVEFTEEKIREIGEILERQRISAVGEERSAELIQNADQNWDNFYGRHSDNFFKDRKWLIREFPEIFGESSVKSYALEVGCGAGNTTFPLLESTDKSNPNLFVYCCDFSPNAVRIVSENEKFNSARCQSFVWDITRSDVEIPIQPSSLDYILAVFVLSALPPEKHVIAIESLARLLKKGGIIYIKDYGRHDLTQLRFKKDKYISENFYARGDGTFTYFFDADELHELLSKAGLTKIENFVDKRMIVNRLEKKNKKQLLRLSCETLKNKAYLEKILDSQNVFRHLIKSRELENNRFLCLVLLYEVLFGIGLKCRDRETKKVFSAAKKDILFEHEQLKSDNVLPESLATSSKSLELPRYVRVNTLKLTVDETLTKLQGAGFNLIDNSEISDQTSFNQAVQNLRKRDFFIDLHLPELLVFNSRVDLHELDIIVNKSLVMQDKASCLPAFILQPTPNSQVLDACAAPGMKTTHLAALMNNEGSIWALDRDKGRCKVLSKMVEEAGAKNCTVLNQDFLKEDTTGEDYSEIEYCLVDAPCSGSGMLKRNDYMQEEFDQKRVSALSNLQSMLLKHALKMPNLKRLVYSTCSIHEDENEKVVQEALNEHEDRFELIDPMPEWERETVEGYEFASKCLRAHPKTNLTNGFFIALFQAK